MVDKIPYNKYQISLPSMLEDREEAQRNIQKLSDFSVSRSYVPQDRVFYDWCIECMSPLEEPYRIPSVELTTHRPEFIVECFGVYFKTMKRDDSCYQGKIDYLDMCVWLYGKNCAIADSETASLLKEYPKND